MNISAPFITRPVMTTLLMAALVLFGVLGYFSMPVSDLPTVDFPTIQVTGELSGASPETMASAVAEPLENNFASIPGIDSMTSTSTLGKTQITLQFALDRDIDGAAQDVQAAISKTQKKLPTTMTTLPYYKKVNPADSPIMYIALSSSVLPLSVVDEYAENKLAQQLSMLNGVAQIDVHGSAKFAVRIQVNPMAMAAHQLSFDKLINTIADANVNIPTGTINGEQQLKTIYVQGQLFTAKEYRPLIVSYENNLAQPLSSIANVIDDVENNQVASWLNGKRDIVLAVRRQPGANTLQVIDNVKQLLPRFQASLPPQLDLKIVFDRSESIKASVHEVKSNLIIATLLVVLVIFLFLKNLSATLIPSIVLPITIIGTFAGMAAFHFSIDNSSLMGLTLAVGFFVDDAIVMLENILRHIEMGKPALQAALDGSKEVAFTIISMTLSLMAAFIPLVFMPGVLGRLLHEFSVTLIMAIAISAFISITLTPMMAGRILKVKEVKTGFLAKFDVAFHRLEQAYEAGLNWSLLHQKKIFLSWLACLVLTAVLYDVAPKGFIPAEDIGVINGSTEASLDTSFAAMVKLQQSLAATLQKDPGVDSLVSVVTDHSTGRFIVRLKPRGDRSNVQTILTRLRKDAEKIPGLRTYLSIQPALTVGGRTSKSEYQYTLQASNLEELYKYSNDLYEKLRKLPSLIDVTTDAQLNNPQLTINIDREKAASMQVSLATIENTLGSALGSQQISTIYGQNDQFQVILEVAPEFQKPEVLQQIYVASDNGNLVPLAALAHIENTVGPASINHQTQTPSLTVSFNIKPGVSLSTAVDEVQNTVQQMHLPADILASFQGNAKAFQDSLKGYGLLIFLAIAVIYILLGILYESFIHPITILSTLPTAGIGALIILILFQAPLDLYGFIGLLMLIGIVKKNAIIMIDFALERKKAGETPLEAIRSACLIRFRPIMMTTFAAFMGALPIVFAFGAGGEARRSLGLAVVGGLLTSQVLTLFSTPIIFLYLDSLPERIKNRWNLCRHG